MSGPVVAVVGMKREARIIGAHALVCQRGAGLEAALRRGGAAVISFGLCGALDPTLRVGDLVIGDAVTDGDRRFDCDPDWTATLTSAFPRAGRGLFWADGQMITGVEQKRALRQATGAIAADMESHIAARAAADHGMPFAIVRSVSDGALTAIPAAARAAFGADGDIHAAAALKRVFVGGPGELLELISVARGAVRAFRTLAAAARAPAVVRL